MPATFLWEGGNLAAAVGVSDSIQFCGGTNFVDPLVVGDGLGQLATFVRGIVGGTDNGELPNCRRINNTQSQFGGGLTVDLSTGIASQCTLRVRITGIGNVGTTNSHFDAYGTTTTDSPAEGDVVIHAFELGDSSWSQLDFPNSKRLSFADQGVALTHDFFVGISVRALTEAIHTDITFRSVIEYYS